MWQFFNAPRVASAHWLGSRTHLLASKIAWEEVDESIDKLCTRCHDSIANEFRLRVEQEREAQERQEEAGIQYNVQSL